jgi:hypothetical protein
VGVLEGCAVATGFVSEQVFDFGFVGCVVDGVSELAAIEWGSATEALTDVWEACCLDFLSRCGFWFW